MLFARCRPVLHSLRSNGIVPTQKYIYDFIMFDLALLSAGACIAEVTSSDVNYPPENIIDG